MLDLFDAGSADGGGRLSGRHQFGQDGADTAVEVGPQQLGVRSRTQLVTRMTATP